MSITMHSGEVANLTEAAKLAGETAIFVPWSEDARTVVIRNTFIEVCTAAKESSKLKRHTMPAALGRKTEEDEMEATCGADRRLPALAASVVDDSTEASDGEKDSIAPEFTSQGDKDSIAPEFTSQGDKDSIAPEFTSQGDKDVASASSDCEKDGEAGSKVVLSTCTGPLRTPSRLPQAAVSGPVARSGGGGGRTPLSSKAKAWAAKPAAEEVNFHVQPSFQQELQMVVEEMKALVLLSGCCEDIDIRWEGPLNMPICRLTAVQHQGQWCYLERLKTSAKEGLMAAVSRSSSVFLIGCKHVAFAAKQGGFCASLAEMHDEAEACWSMYHKGFCSRSGSCRWAHPQTCVSLHFDVVVARMPEQPCFAIAAR